MARCKQFSVQFVSDRDVRKTGFGMDDLGGNFSSVKSAKREIARIRKALEKYNPREFLVFDNWAEPIINPLMNGEEHTPCVYCEL